MFSDNFVKLCARNNVNPTSVSEALGYSRTAGSKWAGGSVPRRTTLQKIADYFGITIDALLSENNEKPTPRIGNGLSKQDERLVRAYHKATEADRQIIDNIVARYDPAEDEALPGKIIPLFGTAAAAGPGEPDTGLPWEDYEVPADSRAEFAVRISGDSMEPVLHDAQIALCDRRRPEIGELTVIMVNGSLLCKQFITDGRNIYLRSLNRARKDCDYDIWESGSDTVKCFGTVLAKHVPLVEQ